MQISIRGRTNSLYQFVIKRCQQVENNDAESDQLCFSDMKTDANNNINRIIQDLATITRELYVSAKDNSKQ